MTEILLAILAVALPVSVVLTWWGMAKRNMAAIAQEQGRLTELYNGFLKKQDEKIDSLWDRLMAASNMGLSQLTQDRVAQAQAEALRRGLKDLVTETEEHDYEDLVGSVSPTFDPRIGKHVKDSPVANAIRTMTESADANS